MGGHAFVGGVINGGCNSAQVGAFFSEDCLPTRSCGELDIECGTLQMQWQQRIGSITATFNTPLETICTRCAEIPSQVPGDCNQDGTVDIADQSCLFGLLFLGSPSELPCGSGGASDAANLDLMDWNGDRVIDLSDGVAGLNWLFDQSQRAGAAHVLGSFCTAIASCSESCGF